MFKRRSGTYTVFHPRNNYPLWVINKVIYDAKKVPLADQDFSSNNDKSFHLMLPYEGDKSFNLLRSMKKFVSNLLPEHTKLEITFTGKKKFMPFNKISNQFRTSTLPNVLGKSYRTILSW